MVSPDAKGGLRRRDAEKVLERAAQSRPLGGNSVAAMDTRRPDCAVYVSTMHGSLIGRDGRVTRRYRTVDTRAAERELAEIIAAGRR
jgi:hypothetical protein